MAINTMGAPDFAPVRQDSQVIRTDAEYEAMRAAAKRKGIEAGPRQEEGCRQASGYNEYANRYRNAPSVAEIMLQTGATAQQAVRHPPLSGLGQLCAGRRIGQQDLGSIQNAAQRSEPRRAGVSVEMDRAGTGRARSFHPTRIMGASSGTSEISQLGHHARC
jgi:hypothetical protein